MSQTVVYYREFHKNASTRKIAYNYNSFAQRSLGVPSLEKQWNVVSYMRKSNPLSSYWQSFAAVKFDKKYAITKLLKFNFIRKSVDATVHVRKMETRASHDCSQKRPTNYCRSCPGQSCISFRKKADLIFFSSKTSLSMVASLSCRCL